MIHKYLAFAILALAVVSPMSTAGEFNGVLTVGDKAPDWKDLPGTDGKTHSLAELSDAKVVVVVFTCNSCPVARDYESRIANLARTHAPQVKVVAINVNRGAEDSLAKMTERAKEQDFPYPYLFDETQQIGRDYGASATPNFFVLSPERKVVYMGAMDDASDPVDVKQKFVEEAVAATLAGKKPESGETFARGCGIRYARQRAK